MAIITNIPSRRVVLAFAVVVTFLGSIPTAGVDTSLPTPALPAGITYQNFHRETPRPLRIHLLKIDLTHPGLTLRVLANPDPDGPGEAETTLAHPMDLAGLGKCIAAVNANAWGMVPDPDTGQKPGYLVGAPANVHGWLVKAREQRSPPGPTSSFWLDAENTPHIGRVEDTPAKTRLAISGFGRLLADGQRVGRLKNAKSAPRHPRTALGLSKDRQTLILCVVDGRQPGVSEGLSEPELADLMAELGSHDALDLDGGGSSAMLVRDAERTLRFVNHPSDLTGPRPIPVMLAVCEAEADSEG